MSSNDVHQMGTDKLKGIMVSKTALISGYEELLYQRASYEHDVINCSTKVFSIEEKEEFREYLNETKGEEQKCSPTVFRKYFSGKKPFLWPRRWYVKLRKTPTKSREISNW